MFGLTASLCSFSMARLDQKCCLDRGTGPSRCDGWTTLESPSSSVAVVLSPPLPSHLHLRSPADDSESPPWPLFVLPGCHQRDPEGGSWIVHPRGNGATAALGQRLASAGTALLRRADRYKSALKSSGAQFPLGA